MNRDFQTIWCENCGVEITWAPVAADDRYYCCNDCQQGFRCDCARRMEQEEERRSAVPETSETY